ncbi:MAG: aldo/keto reductase, partial [Frankiales bacterium]|nr:aldo/keto reductase [Frankiales bacterium]
VWGEPDHDKSIDVIHRALDAGINFIDTADFYSQGESEEIVGKALVGGRRDEVVLASKAGLPIGAERNQRGNSRRWLTTEVENSLRRLGTDHLDLYQIHRPDDVTDLEETLAALTDLVRAGKIRYFGCSTFPAHRIVESHWVAERRGLYRFVTEQPPYSILARGIEREVLPVTQQFDMGVLVWSPLAGGWLTGRFRAGQEPPATQRRQIMPDRWDPADRAYQEKLAAVERLAVLAEQAGMSLIEMALAFTVSPPGVTSAIIGPRTQPHFDSQIAAGETVLGADLLDAIDQIVAPGVTIDARDGGYAPPALRDSSLRRRPVRQ